MMKRAGGASSSAKSATSLRDNRGPGADALRLELIDNPGGNLRADLVGAEEI